MRDATSVGRTPRVVATVLTFNNLHDTEECLAALEALTPPCDAVVLIDNGTTDGSSDQLLARHPRVHGVRLGRNVGFTGGANRALAEALRLDADYVLFLANDTVPEPGMLAALLDAARADVAAGLFGPRVMEYGAPSVLQHGAGFIDARTGRVDVRDLRRAQACDWVTGCGFLVRADVLRTMAPPAGFDERFFLYWEDVDFSRRVAEAGYGVLYVPQARLAHKETDARRATMNDAKRRSRMFYMLRNRFLFARRHLGRGARLRMLLRTLVSEVPRSLARALRHPRSGAADVLLLLRALGDGLRGRRGRATHRGLYQ